MLCRLLALAAAAAAFAPPSGLTARSSVAMSATMSKSKLTTMVKGLTKETFESIYEQEAWIVENGGSTLVKKTLKRVDHKAKSFGLTMKPEFLAGHKIMVKHKEKREEFFARKTEEVKAAEEEAAAAAEAAAAEAAEAAASPPRGPRPRSRGRGVERAPAKDNYRRRLSAARTKASSRSRRAQSSVQKGDA
ncbi:hypothetical protein JL722_2607 [Aureococcus anophagefferens]|nr:hypothetical protein JL722_2607 [Aureococcus anophagefferens]